MVLNEKVRPTILDLLKNRCSVRKFKDKKISEDIIDYIIECGRLSPSGGNEQAWKFGIITNKEIISYISKIAYNQSWIKTAPLLIVLCTKIIADDRGGRFIQQKRFPEFYDDITNMNKELYSKIHQEEHQTKIPGTHMVLAALEHGVGSTWVSYFEVEKLRELLNLSEGYLPSEILVFGYPLEETKKKLKKSTDEIVFYNRLC